MGVEKKPDFSGYPRSAIILPDASQGQREEEVSPGDIGLDSSYVKGDGSGYFPLNGQLDYTKLQYYSGVNRPAYTI